MYVVIFEKYGGITAGIVLQAKRDSCHHSGGPGHGGVAASRTVPLLRFVAVRELVRVAALQERAAALAWPSPNVNLRKYYYAKKNQIILELSIFIVV